MTELVAEEKRFDISLLRNITVMGPVIEKYAKNLAVKSYNIPEEHFSVRLVPNLNGNMLQVFPGYTVEILIAWPHAILELNSILRDAFSIIKKYHLRKTMEIATYSLIWEARHKWNKAPIKNLMEQFIGKSRISMTESTTVTLEDAITGEKVSITREGKPRRFDGGDIGLWMQLSMQVRDKHPIIDEIEDSTDKSENEDV